MTQQWNNTYHRWQHFKNSGKIVRFLGLGGAWENFLLKSYGLCAHELLRNLYSLLRNTCDVTWHTLNDSISLSITFCVDRLLDVMLKFQARYQNFKILISAFDWLREKFDCFYLNRGSERRGWITGAWTVIGLESIVVESKTESSSSLASIPATGGAVGKLYWILKCFRIDGQCKKCEKSFLVGAATVDFHPRGLIVFNQLGLLATVDLKTL